MKTIFRILCALTLFTLVVFPLAGVQSALAGQGVNPSAFIPWRSENAYAVSSPEYISVGFSFTKSHPQQKFPLVSYTLADEPNQIYFMHPADVYVGDCGEGFTWNCSILDADAAQGTISRLQTYAFLNTFKVGWVYKDRLADENRLHWVELTEGLENAGEGDGLIIDYDLYDINGQNWTQFDPASIAYDEFGNLHMAVILQYSSMRKLIYAHKLTSGEPTTPCNNELNTRYQCDIIVENNTGMRDVNLVLNSDNQPRISWFNFYPHSLMYAYPQSNSNYHPNCGPGGNTWRCITIEASSSELNFYPDGEIPQIDMAIGPASPHMIIEGWDQTENAHILHAEFVGYGGNCGEDFALISVNPVLYGLVNRWSCSSFLWDPEGGAPLFNDFSLKVDSYDYPLIALNRLVGVSHQVGVVYDAERRGGTPGTWYFDDAVAYGFFNVGRGLALAIGQNDSLLMGYTIPGLTEQELIIAIQDVSKVFIPIVRR